MCSKVFDYTYICVYMCVLFFILLYYRLLQDIKYSSLCYTVNFCDLWEWILNLCPHLSLCAFSFSRHNHHKSLSVHIFSPIWVWWAELQLFWTRYIFFNSCIHLSLPLDSLSSSLHLGGKWRLYIIYIKEFVFSCLLLFVCLMTFLN